MTFVLLILNNYLRISKHYVTIVRTGENDKKRVLPVLFSLIATITREVYHEHQSMLIDSLERTASYNCIKSSDTFFSDTWRVINCVVCSINNCFFITFLFKHFAKLQANPLITNLLFHSWIYSCINYTHLLLTFSALLLYYYKARKIISALPGKLYFKV